MPAAEEPAVAVFGSSDPAEADEGYAVAREVGRRLAEAGYTVANGGYGGTMEASARGAVEAGGHTVGVTCSCWAAAPNAYIRQVVETATLAERLECLARLGRAGFVALPGATGTLVELARVWEGMLKGLMPRLPLVCVGEFWRPLVERIALVRPDSARIVRVIGSPAELADPFPPRR